MANTTDTQIYQFENQEWIDSLQYIIQEEGPERVREILTLLNQEAQKQGIATRQIKTPYINTIPPEEEEEYPGNLELEEKLSNLIRWNALAMVMQANKKHEGIGGHISTYASVSTLFEVGFHHFFRGPEGDGPADIVFYQGHASPGVYARSFLEGRFNEEQLQCFRQEIRSEQGLSSYPHPRLMPEYWSHPTVSMGLGPVQAIYQARFNQYLEDRGLKEPSDQKVWGFFGDGEMDEPESLGALAIASREKLGNLIFVINCNLQRLDGPVRGNYKVIQELEGVYRGAGWNVIKVIWGSDWDALLAKDTEGRLVKRMNEVIDGQYQLYTVQDGKFIREDFFGKDDYLLELVEDMSDEDLEHLTRGGHDPVKVYQAYRKAVEYTEGPTVILAQTIKGYGLGEAGEASNVTHKRKKLEEEDLITYRNRFNLPVSDEGIAKAPFFRPDEDSEEIKYLLKRREKLGGLIPRRKPKAEPITEPDEKLFEEYRKGDQDREIATTMVMVQLMSKLMKDKEIGDKIVPIIPDESRTFGMDALFRQFGIYSHVGQRYEPVDKGSLMYYREAKEGAILEEGITEIGSMASFIAAGTAYSTHGMPMIPLYFFYSMFGFQRTGDMMWAAADARARGFLIGGTSGRTTLPGEGLQHQDGQSHLLALPYPNLMAYDPAFAYEVATIVKEGLKRMYVEQEDIFYYITVMNDNYPMPPMPEDSEAGILKGMYCYRRSEKEQEATVHLLGSGAILVEVLKAADRLEEEYDVTAHVWSVTSYKALYDDALETDRWNRLHPDEEPQLSYIQQCTEEESGAFLAVSDYVKALPLSVARWFPRELSVLGTDGFGRSDTRDALRDFFEVDQRYIVLAALDALRRQDQLDTKIVEKALKDLNIDSDKANPMAY
jgi:pyruvate dehydrogenase E1 component